MAASPLISRWQLITREEDGGDTVVPTAPASYAPAARSAWLQRVGPRPAGPAPVDLDVRRGVDSWIAGVQSKVDDDVERMMEAELRGGLDPYSRSSDAAHVLQALANEQARSVGASLFANVAHRDTAPLFGARHGANKADEGGTGEEEEDVDAATMLSRAIDRELERITEDERTASSGASSASRGRGSGGGGSGGGGSWDDAGAFLEMLQRTEIAVDARGGDERDVRGVSSSVAPAARSASVRGASSPRRDPSSIAALAAAAKERDGGPSDEDEDEVAARGTAQRLVRRWAHMESEADAIRAKVRREVGLGERRRADARAADASSYSRGPQLRSSGGGSSGEAGGRSGSPRRAAARRERERAAAKDRGDGDGERLRRGRAAVLSERSERALQAHLARRSVVEERRAAAKEAEAASEARYGGRKSAALRRCPPSQPQSQSGAVRARQSSRRAPNRGGSSSSNRGGAAPRSQSEGYRHPPEAPAELRAILSAATSESLLRAGNRRARQEGTMAKKAPDPAAGPSPRSVKREARRVRIAMAVQHRVRHDGRQAGRIFGVWRDIARRSGIRMRRNERVVEINGLQRMRKQARAMLRGWSSVASTLNPALVAQADTFSRWRLLLQMLRRWCIFTRHSVAERASSQMRVRLRRERERDRLAMHHLRMRLLSRSWLQWMVHHRHHRHRRILEGRHLERRAKMELVLQAQQRTADAARNPSMIAAAPRTPRGAAPASPGAALARRAFGGTDAPLDALSFIAVRALPVPVLTPQTAQRCASPASSPPSCVALTSGSSSATTGAAHRRQSTALASIAAKRRGTPVREGDDDDAAAASASAASGSNSAAKMASARSRGRGRGRGGRGRGASGRAMADKMAERAAERKARQDVIRKRARDKAAAADQERIAREEAVAQKEADAVDFERRCAFSPLSSPRPRPPHPPPPLSL